MKAAALLCVVAGAAFGATVSAPMPGNAATDPSTPLPMYLRDTGLYAAGSGTTVRAENVPFSPQYPLWSDGTTKRRWIYLPPGTAIDASRVDAWEFPPGTRVWKEFSHERRVETRLIERLAEGSWRYATYVWNAEGTDAILAPADGVAVPLPAAPGGRYSVPSRDDCLACHEGVPVPVLGFSALQLSPDRDSIAPHAEAVPPEYADLRSLAARGSIRNLPQSLLDRPPRIVAPTPTARAALGYLHGNCGHCHNDGGAVAGLDLLLAQQTADPEQSTAKVLHSLVGHTSRHRAQGSKAAQRVVPGSAGTSVIAARMQSANPFARMPPLGVQVIDKEGLELVERWIEHDLHFP